MFIIYVMDLSAKNKKREVHIFRKMKNTARWKYKKKKKKKKTDFVYSFFSENAPCFVEAFF